MEMFNKKNYNNNSMKIFLNKIVNPDFIIDE